jgi:hypothetical protein
MRDIFIVFLKHYNIHDQYEFNVIQCHGYNMQLFFSYLDNANLNISQHYSYLRNCFQWDQTKEGYNYWDKYYREWIKVTRTYALLTKLNVIKENK